jgi:hypothetical protein
MPEVQDYVEGLSGEEIIIDVLDQVAAKLHGDCNLRENDNYTGGYDGYVEVHLNLHGLDKVNVKTRIIIGTEAPDPDQKTIDARVDIPLVPELNTVRERSGQGIPTMAKDEDGRPVVKKRHYGKARGGALEIQLPDLAD